jgi:hypothetical protein
MDLNNYYYSLFLALSDVGPALSKSFLKVVEKRILERYELDYKLLKSDVKFSYKVFKRDKKELQRKIRRAQRRYYKALKKGEDTTRINFTPRYSPKEGEKVNEEQREDNFNEQGHAESDKN